MGNSERGLSVSRTPQVVKTTHTGCGGGNPPDEGIPGAGTRPTGRSGAGAPPAPVTGMPDSVEVQA
ncbi:hypothetical protein SLNWT_2345 [Streptomyces albus]|uniref:Uncharacterized protein n=1 Tax=Streptomyces albus (strain ATCC 21838 / DSM 41398 / FERM P-419 / JCM 4703 / NBRC 107858) TaxID=1081613 RepID=A0A0B5EVK9_STRA4|nr:hypothetical protein SLNWT_2345 [Streptomyces albus]AOU77033.1 hypothetical protein SLNHY_2342 [Streptomyces albus]